MKTPHPQTIDIGSLLLVGSCALLASLVGACSQSVGLGMFGMPVAHQLVHDEFVVASAGKKVDLLFVVDNSRSMADNQETLANSFASFLSNFSAKKLNFQIGVITTDNHAYDPTDLAGGWAATMPGFFHDGPGTLIVAKAGLTGVDAIVEAADMEHFLKTMSPDLEARFKNTVKVGSLSGPDEAGLLSLTNAFALSKRAAGSWNAGFFRDDAFLSIVVVSDEDESLTGSEANRDQYVRYFPEQKQQRITQFLEAAKALKKLQQNAIRLDAVVAVGANHFPATAPAAPCSGGVSLGSVYMQMAQAFDGEVVPICNDFSGPLAEIGSKIALQVSAHFGLSKRPLGDIQVLIDGQTIPESLDASVAGWHYTNDLNQIVLSESLLERGGTLKVTYDAYQTASDGLEDLSKLSLIPPQPASPSRAMTFKLQGELNSEFNLIDLYSNSVCTTKIGTLNADEFKTQGVVIAATPNKTNYVFAIGTNAKGESTSCFPLSSFTNDLMAPDVAKVVYTGIFRPSVTVQTRLTGLVPKDVKTVSISVDDACANPVARGTKADFADQGILVSLKENASLSYYIQLADEAGNVSACAEWATLVHDNRVPEFSNISNTVSFFANYAQVLIKGKVSEGATLSLFSDALCSVALRKTYVPSVNPAGLGSLTGASIGTSADLFHGTLSFVMRRTSPVNVYARAVDNAYNISPCVHLFEVAAPL